MIVVHIVDKSAESRQHLVEQLTSILAAASPALHTLPQITFKPLTIQELRFHAAPDICVIGSEIVSYDLTEINKIKKLLPQTALLAHLTHADMQLTLVEQLARVGVDDVFRSTIAPLDFVQKLLMLVRRGTKESRSSLVLVDSGKGGLGVTSIVSALGEIAAETEQKVLLIDSDSDTQDLSRFMQVRPFVNENLQIILEENRPLVMDFAKQCYSPIWSDSDLLHCMQPVIHQAALYDPRSPFARTYLSLLETFDELFDLIIVDLAGVRSSLVPALQRVADKIILVLNNDPASLYASAAKIKELRVVASAGCEIMLLENATTRRGIASTLLRKEFARVAGLEDEQWINTVIPYCRRAARWAGSGATFYSQGGTAVKQALKQVAVESKIINDQNLEKTLLSKGLFSQLFKWFKTVNKKAGLKNVPTSHLNKHDLLQIKSNSNLELSLIESPKLISHDSETEYGFVLTDSPELRHSDQESIGQVENLDLVAGVRFK
jgi:cellulose biosynthesis protein BcsQ